MVAFETGFVRRMDYSVARVEVGTSEEVTAGVQVRDATGLDWQGGSRRLPSFVPVPPSLRLSPPPPTEAVDRMV